MLNRSLEALAAAACLALVVGQSSAHPTSIGEIRRDPDAGTSTAGCPSIAFAGDLGPEIGVGCSQGGGTSGGPIDVAQGAFISVPPPFLITSHFYNIFTQVSPNITSLSFVVWRGAGSTPGAEVARIPGLDYSAGTHSAFLPGGVTITSADVPSALLYFGQSQPQTNVGLRWGVDTSSGSWGLSYIRAPACGNSSFVTLDSIGTPGNWAMAVCIETFVPVELKSWGALKAVYR